MLRTLNLNLQVQRGSFPVFWISVICFTVQVISGLSLNSKGKIGHLILVSDAHCEEDEEDEEDEDEEDEDEEDEDEEFDHL